MRDMRRCATRRGTQREPIRTRRADWIRSRSGC
nr:MAG TPA_asm: hypothetical protein [Caudoviricetes sp.]